jgi:hypothetical protein
MGLIAKQARRSMLMILSTPCNFKAVATGNDTWFLYTRYADSMFAASAAEVIPGTRQKISAMRTTVAIFLISTQLLNSLPKGTKAIKIIALMRSSEISTAKRHELRGPSASRV